MKVNDKRKIILAIDTMKEAHRNLIENDNLDILELLQLCQEMAIGIGNKIETQEEGDCPYIIGKLEEYCECVFETTIALQESAEQYKKSTQKLMDIICEIQLHIEQNIKEEKMKVVFLPYIASMWDALDSIYRAALKDSDWESYVMPVPYYTLNSKKEIVADNYEGDLYPDEIKIVDYREITLEELKPDVIFYHNPYDDRNLVTRIHPEFYSTNLLKITEHLVYIPYYNSEEYIDDIMLLLPGIRNAWKVIVQTENLRQQYLNLYRAEKIVALGSPKIDMLFKDISDYTTIPNEWKKKMQDRKVILYNTHLSSIIQSPEQFIIQLEKVILVLQSYKDIVILWRPHPLMQKTMISFQVNSEIQREYLEIIDEFKKLENAIYDDTSELERSICLADAYMGSKISSVYQLFQKTGKSMYAMKEVYDGYEKYFNKVKSTGGVIKDKYLWQFSVEYNALFKMDLETHKNQFVTSFSNYQFCETFLLKLTATYRDWLVLVPYIKKEMILYNVMTDETKYIKLEDQDFKTSQYFKVTIMKGDLWLFPACFSEYNYVVSLKNFTLRKQSTNLKELISKGNKNFCDLIFGDSCINENYLWRTLQMEPYLLRYSYKDNTYKMFDVDSGQGGYKKIVLDGNYFWLAPKKGNKLVKWDYLDQEIQTIELCNMAISLELNMEDMVKIKQYLVITFLYLDAIVVFDTKTNKMKGLKEKNTNKICNKDKCVCYGTIINNEEEVYLPAYEAESMLKIDVDLKTSEEIDGSILDCSFVDKCVKSEILETDRISVTDQIYSLDKFIEQLLFFTPNTFPTKRSDAEVNVGTNIWNYITNQKEKE